LNQRTARSLNILHVGKYFSPFRGGLENYLRDLMVALARRGTASTALVHRHDWSFCTRQDSVSLDGREFRVVRTGTWAKLLFTPLSPAFPWHLRRLIGAGKPDILHLHMPNPSVFWALLLPSARRVPWVVHWHADVISDTQGRLMKLAYAVYRPFERAVLRRARAIIVTSVPYRDSSQPLRPWLSKCRVVPLGLDVGRLPVQAQAEPAAKGSPENQTLPFLKVLAVGRLTYYKGFQYLIEALARLDNVQLELVGEGDRAGELSDGMGPRWSEAWRAAAAALVVLAWLFAKYMQRLEFLSGLILAPAVPKRGTEMEVSMTRPAGSAVGDVKVGDQGDKAFP